MSSGIYVASAGAIAQSNALDATANNIANASTAGFHGDAVTFKQVMTQARSPDVGLVDAGTARIDSQPGALNPTGNPLDLALEGDGYFSVQSEQGTRYTRAGNFELDPTGKLVTSEGLQVNGEHGAPITIPPGASNVQVASDGTVSADGTTVGKLELVKLKSSQLQRQGGSLFAATGTPEPGAPPTVRSGMLESSNVNVVRGVVDLVKVSRTYESLMQVIQGFHDVESRAAETLGAPK